jgi:hypothetical protein
LTNDFYFYKNTTALKKNTDKLHKCQGISGKKVTTYIIPVINDEENNSETIK